MSTEPTRPLCVIARDIRKNWSNVNYAAKPYLNAMTSLDTMEDRLGWDDGASIVRYFLSNARSWRGEDARRIKAELRSMLP